MKDADSQIIALLNQIKAVSGGTDTVTGGMRVYNVMDYGAVGNGTHDDTTAIQAAIDAADNLPGGTVYFPNGAYKVTTGLVVGSGNTSGNGRSSNVSLVGESQLNTMLRYYGSTSGVAVLFNKNKYGSLKNMRISNYSGSKGTTEGLQTSGPTFGTNSNGNVIESVYIEGFHYGWHTSSNTGGLSGNTSSEITAINLSLQGNDTGFRSDDFNALNFVFINLQIGDNTTAGLDTNTSGVHVFGGSSGANAIDFSINGPGACSIIGFRSEVAGQFLRFNADNTSMLLQNCDIGDTSDVAITIVHGNLEINGCNVAGEIFFEANGCGLTMRGVKVKNAVPFTVSGAFTFGRYRQEHCSVYSIDSSVATLVPDRQGVILTGGVMHDTASGSATTADYQVYASVATKTGNYAMVETDGTILADATSAPLTITLPAASAGTQNVRVKKIDSSGNAVTVARAGADTIEGGTSLTLSAQYDSTKLQSNRTSIWYKF